MNPPRDATGSPIALLTFGEAAQVGERVHDHWLKQAGSVPFARDDLAWGDLVQQVLREADAAWRARDRACADVEGVPV